MIRPPPISTLFPYTTLFRSPGETRSYCGPQTGFSFSWVLPLLLGRKRDRKSTRLNSSHVSISYAVFCLKKKKIIQFYSPFDIFYFLSLPLGYGSFLPH